MSAFIRLVLFARDHFYRFFRSLFNRRQGVGIIPHAFDCRYCIFRSAAEDSETADHVHQNHIALVGIDARLVLSQQGCQIRPWAEGAVTFFR